ncbi:MAG: hypothetical protein JWN95_439 [Frankiales bacterium]|nr:hypothetical protein [Frankiales bacterium]
MHDPLHRLYRTKLALLATTLFFVGLGLLILGHWLPHIGGWQWIANWPIVDIGSGLFTTGLLGVGLQYLDGEDSELRDTARLERVLATATPAMRDAVIAGFAFEPVDIARVATPDTLDQIVANGLGLRLGDQSFAEELYGDIRKQAVEAPERLEDVRVAVRLSMDRSTTDGRAPLLIATMHWEVRLRPHFATRRFSAVSSLTEYRDIAQDTAANSAWFVGRRVGLLATDRAAFELLDFTVNGASRTIRRAARKGGQTYSVNLGQAAIDSPEPVTLDYTYRTVVPLFENLLQLRVDQPTRGLSVTVDYSDTDFDHLNVLDFIASSERARISRSPGAAPGNTVSVEFNGWVMPRAGIAFVWPRNS